MMKNEVGVRIEEMLCQLADATRIDGEIWRAAYTLEDKIAKNILREWIEDLGLEYREDAIGNVYGRLPGTEPGTILTGSHLDTVKNGGKYDGALGVVTGVAALGYLKQSGFVPKHSLEVGGLMEEEGSRFPSGCQGSRAAVRPAASKNGSPCRRWKTRPDGPENLRRRLPHGPRPRRGKGMRPPGGCGTVFYLENSARRSPSFLSSAQLMFQVSVKSSR